MIASDKVAAAARFVRKQGKKALRDLTAWDIARNFHLRSADAERVLHAEMIRRRMITLADLTPPQRRNVIDPENIDLHAIAAGPIMDANEIFLPAGRISIEEARAREAATIVPPSDQAGERA